jgi:hypothetical protein
VVCSCATTPPMGCPFVEVASLSPAAASGKACVLVVGGPIVKQKQRSWNGWEGDGKKEAESGIVPMCLGEVFMHGTKYIEVLLCQALGWHKRRAWTCAA